MTASQFRAFLSLRQSVLTPEDKKKMLTMTGGDMETKKVGQSMRTLATSVLSTEPKKKIYPTNYVDAEATNVSKDEDNQAQNVYYVQAEEEDALNVENLECMALNGDEDALLIQQFERNFEDMMQNIPELQSALLSHQEARQRISKRRRSRGFWPSRCCKSGKDQGKWFRKGGPRSSKDELLARI